MTAKQASFYRFPTGKYKGRTLLQIDLIGDRKYLEWAAKEWDEKATRDAVATFLNFFPFSLQRKRLT
jgi:hypothetical protein